ncbi:hypothetical protein [Aeromonas caviae]|uniref:hypothetical protein n=1 Tax=Aeromonas caviae TaxID=648 RepID=UPI0009E34B79
MMKPAEAEKLTGYKVGWAASVPWPRRSCTVLDDSAMAFDEILVSGGKARQSAPGSRMWQEPVFTPNRGLC